MVNPQSRYNNNQFGKRHPGGGVRASVEHFLQKILYETPFQKDGGQAAGTG